MESEPLGATQWNQSLYTLCRASRGPTAESEPSHTFVLAQNCAAGHKVRLLSIDVKLREQFPPVGSGENCDVFVSEPRTPGSEYRTF